MKSIFVLKILCLLLLFQATFQGGIVFNNGSLNVSWVQLNDTELSWIKNSTIFESFLNYFTNTIATAFEGKYCKELQNIYSTAGYDLKSFFSPIFDFFLAQHCNKKNCILSEYWNTTTQNHMNSMTFLSFISTSIYLIFPLFIIILMGVLYFGLFNCMYCSYCYMCCFIFEVIRKTDSYYKKLLFLIGILSICYIGIGIFTEARLTTLDSSFDIALCQTVTSLMYQTISGVNLTFGENKGKPNPQISWSGLTYLNSSFREYYAYASTWRDSLISNSYLQGTDLNDVTYETFLNGVEQYRQFIVNTSFELVDPNGMANNDFKITYYCEKCKKAVDPMKDALIEINSTLRVWQKNLSDFRVEMYNSYISDSGWKKTQGLYNDTIEEITKATYQSLKFYNIVSENFNNTKTALGAIYYVDVIVFLTNSAFCIAAIVSFFLLRKSITKVNSIPDHDLQDAEQRSEARVEWRWILHIVINCNMLSAMMLVLFSFVFIILGLMIYEGGTVVEIKFYNDKQLFNFTFLPHGKMIDLCTSTGNCADFLKIKFFYDYHMKMANFTQQIKANGSFPDGLDYPPNPMYKKLAEYCRGIQLSNFRSKTNNALIWDEKGEQVNYFLGRIDYKYLTAAPKEFVQQYTDYSYDDTWNKNYPNYQKTLCNKGTSYDAWADSESTCRTKYPAYMYYAKFNQIKLEKKCLPLSLSVSEAICPDQTLPSCMTEQFVKRYIEENDFEGCVVSSAMLATTGDKTAADYFRTKIRLLLGNGMQEIINEKALTQLKNTFISKFEALVDTNYQIYIQKLKETKNNFLQYEQQFENLALYFDKYPGLERLPVTNAVNKEGILKNTNCEFMKNVTLIFDMSRKLISEEFFGLSILFLGSAIFLFIDTLLISLIFFKLRSDKELSDIRSNLNTIQCLEEKELKYFYESNNYIEEDDKKIISEAREWLKIHDKKIKEKKQMNHQDIKKDENEKEQEEMNTNKEKNQHMNEDQSKLQIDKSNVNLIPKNLKNNTGDGGDNRFDKIHQFIYQQEKEAEERIRNQEYKKAEKTALEAISNAQSRISQKYKKNVEDTLTKIGKEEDHTKQQKEE